MLASELFTLLDECFKPELQEEYDNAGPQVLLGDAEIKAILVSLDCDRQIVGEAREKECQAIVTHHPLFFRALERVDTSEYRSSLVVELLRENICLYSAHTNLDKLFFDKLSLTLGFEEPTLLIETDPEIDSNPVGFGAVADLPEPASLESILQRVKRSLGLDYLIYTGSIDQQITRLAFLNGSGGGAISSIIEKSRVDCIITGDVGYHHAKSAIGNGVVVIDAGHFGTERVLLTFLSERLNDFLTKMKSKKDMQIYISEIEKNPFQVYVKSDE